MKPSPEAPNTRERIRTVMWIAAMGMVAIGTVAYLDRQDPAEAYANLYTDNNGCLDQTAFDLDEGATSQSGIINQTRILTVRPGQTETYDPSALSFVITGNAFTDRQLSPANDLTASFLEEAGC